MSTEPVGTLAEEAAKLVTAMQGWAQNAGPTAETADPASVDGDSAHPDHDPLSTQCRYCPLCTLVRVAKATTPEVRDHLASAALSLALAFKGLADNASPATPGATPVEKIDLAED